MKSIVAAVSVSVAIEPARRPLPPTTSGRTEALFRPGSRPPAAGPTTPTTFAPIRSIASPTTITWSTATSYRIPARDALPSQDGDYWIFYRDGQGGSQSIVYCFFVPMNF